MLGKESDGLHTVILTWQFARKIGMELAPLSGAIFLVV